MTDNDPLWARSCGRPFLAGFLADDGIVETCRQYLTCVLPIPPADDRDHEN